MFCIIIWLIILISGSSCNRSTEWTQTQQCLVYISLPLVLQIRTGISFSLGPVVHHPGQDIYHRVWIYGKEDAGVYLYLYWVFCDYHLINVFSFATGLRSLPIRCLLQAKKAIFLNNLSQCNRNSFYLDRYIFIFCWFVTVEFPVEPFQSLENVG